MSNTKKKLTKKQKKFLDVLFGEAQGNLVRAKQLAGYRDSTQVSDVVPGLKAEIAERTSDYIASNGPKAAIAVGGVIDNPTALGNKDVLSAAKDILDRAGIKAVEKIEVTAHNPLFILPPKVKSDEN